MALSRELIRRLNIDEEPLSKRLKLAENAFASKDLPIARKEDLILKWLCRVAVEKKKSKKKYKIVWSALLRCLESKNASSNVIFKSNVKQILIDTLIEKLSNPENEDFGVILDCCRMIFICQETHRYFRFDLARLCELIQSIFASIIDNYESIENLEEDVNDSRAIKCAISGVECFVSCYKQSVDKDELANIFVGQILYPLCRLVKRSRSEKLGAETYKSVGRLIFGKSRCIQFREYDGTDENNFAARLFVELRKKAETSDEDTTVVVFSYVFRAAVGSYKNDPAAIERIFRYLIDSASGTKIKVLLDIRQLLTDLTFDYKKIIGDSNLFDYFLKFVDEILSSKHLDYFHYEALGVVALLNPLIIEIKMQNILKRILLEKKETKNEIDSYRDLMIVLINTGVKLKREQKLVPWILKAIEEEITKSSKNFDVETIFPMDFKKHFSKSVTNMTSTQTVGVLRTFIFHLDNCIESSVKDKKIATFILRANVELISAYFEGVRIFDNSIPILWQKKFVQALSDLGKTLSLLIDNVLKIDGNKKMIATLLTATWYWENIHDWMRYYALDALPEKLDFPISEIRIKQIIAYIGNDAICKNALNKILVWRMGRNLEEGTSPDFSSLLDGLEMSWPIILDENPQIVSTMNNSQIVQLSRFLLDDVVSGYEVDAKFMKILSSESVQNEEKFINALVYQALADIAKRVNDSTTKIIMGRVNVIKILNRGNASKSIKKIKNDLMKKEWMSFSEESIFFVEKILKFLLLLPLKHLGLDPRTLLLLVVYAIKQECDHNETIFQLCTNITLDVLEKFDIDIIDLIDIDFLINELTRDKSMQRVVESSLRNVSTWETLKILIKGCQRNENDSAIIFLECIERVRPKLKNEEREIFKKAAQKLSKKLLDGIDEESHDCNNIKRMTLVLKVFMTTGKISDHLMAITKSMLYRIFVSEESKDDQLIAVSLQLVNVVLKYCGKLELTDDIVNNVWLHVLNNPSKEIAQPLLERTDPKVLSKLFIMLNTKTIRGLAETNETYFTSASMIWDSIMSVKMGGLRHKLRTAALHNLLQTLQISAIPGQLWPAVLKLVQSTLSESLHVLDKGIDVVMLLAGRSLKEAELSVCGDVLAMCYTLVKFNGNIITDRLPVLLALYRQLVRLVVRESRKDNDSSQQRKLVCLALDIEKFTNALVKLKKDLARISPYVIADIIEIFSEGVIPPRVKGPLEDSVSHFLSISDQHAISLLSRTLPIATRELFKTLYETYNRFYKYTGKI